MKYSESTNSPNFQGVLRKGMLALFMVLFTGSLSGVFAADAAAGQALFKENCGRCHSTNLANDLTGPALAGLEGRMTDNEIDQATLYEWIRNSSKIREESDYFANLFKEWNGIQMDPMPHLTDENIANILEWIYTWQPPAAPTTTGAEAKYMEDDETVSSMWSWLRILIFVILALLGNIALQVARLRGVEVLAGVDLNIWNGRIMLAFLVLGLGGVFWSVFAYNDTYLLSNAASEHGVAIDRMFWITMAVTFAVFVITNILLFFFAFRYSQEPNRKARYYPENQQLEMLWTAVPAVVLTILVVFGIKTWNTVMGQPEEPVEEQVFVELNAYQFGWTIRYPGMNNDFGDADVRRISGTNMLGVDFSQSKSRDDFISNDIVIPKGKRVVLKIKSRDVLHSAYLPHFRVKMDAVPGMDTRFHFIPTITTDSMRVMKENAEFNYELACTEVCGRGHFSMRKVVKVVEFDEWVAWRDSMVKTPIYNAEVHGTELMDDPANLKPSTGLTAGLEQ